MDAGLRRWLVPAGAALAVVLVVAAVWWSQRPGDAGPGSATTPPSASAAPGFPGQDGGGDPANPGHPDKPDGGLTPVPGPDSPPPRAGTQAIEGWFARDDRTLALNYATGVPECYGTVGKPQVEETASTVTVTLPKTPPKSDREVVCIDIAVLRSVDVTLASPLGDREVRDGSRDGIQVPRADAPYGDGSEGEPAY